MDKNLFVWEKWIDPFSLDETNEKLEEYSREALEEEFNNSYEDLYNSNQETEEKIELPISVLQTPMGIIPINEDSLSSKIFNFWIGHCRFNLTEEIAHIIEQVPGVETLDIFTRYRFRMSVGRRFIPRRVFYRIATEVDKHLQRRGSLGGLVHEFEELCNEKI